MSPAGVDVLVRTFNSARTLEAALASARRYLPVHRLIVIDRASTDGTPEIVRRYGGELYVDEQGIGRATTRAVELAETRLVLFLDSDVTIVRADFYPEATRAISHPRVGAVVGTPIGHPFLYGLPLGLTLLPRTWAREVAIPPDAQGEETYYIRRALRRSRRRIAYVPDAIHHTSPYRGRHWPEWQGAQLRRAAGWSVSELTYSFFVILMIHANSRSARNLAYTPIFYLKLLRGFLDPHRWWIRDRRSLPANESP
ncbi:MAG: glycosyltransferase family 2 protein [Thermoplasmata archaeon]